MKFREISRLSKYNTKLERAEIEEVLNAEYHGVLSTLSEHGFPMSIPICYIYHNGAIYFHSSTSGEKCDNMTANPKVSFLVYRKQEPSQNPGTGKFQSVLIYGNAVKMIPSDPEASEALKKMPLHFDLPRKATDAYIEAGAPHSFAFRIDIIHISGKGQLVF